MFLTTCTQSVQSSVWGKPQAAIMLSLVNKEILINKNIPQRVISILRLDIHINIDIWVRSGPRCETLHISFTSTQTAYLELKLREVNYKAPYFLLRAKIELMN